MTMFKKANWDSDVLGQESYQELFKKSRQKSNIEVKIRKKKHHVINQMSTEKIELSTKKTDNDGTDIKVTKKANNIKNTEKKLKLIPETGSSEILTKSRKKRMKKLKKKMKYQNEDKDNNEGYKNSNIGSKSKSINAIFNNKQDKLGKKYTKLNGQPRQEISKAKLKKIDEYRSSADDVGTLMKKFKVGLKKAENLNNGQQRTILNKSVNVKHKRYDLVVGDELISTRVNGVDLRKRKFLDKLKVTLGETRVEKTTLSLRQRMLEKLKAARFRFLNEEIYTSDSKEAQKIFHNDPEAFEAYHDGYRQQVKRWPLNPLDNIIKSIHKMPKTLIVADLGCGDARLSRSIPQKVFSFDLIAVNDSVTACDMSKLPLEDGVIDVAVFCLSLMGTNLDDYLIEAHRVMKDNGILKIAEVESRFGDVDKFINDLQKYGFRNTLKDFSHNLFYFLDFKKQSSIRNKKTLPKLTLLPCLYKKR
ncbi:unnamed protein product [Phaedon cochleariae]|uniref:Ribosomal RNA-processing protein 8 n=1 Tax=Phaedon cochleariae TaxID=80249 RepID=A0A9P0DX61_PHACE|nr:unnamed protein product [Phaedon cochleariae]